MNVTVSSIVHPGSSVLTLWSMQSLFIAVWIYLSWLFLIFTLCNIVLCSRYPFNSLISLLCISIEFLSRTIFIHCQIGWGVKSVGFLLELVTCAIFFLCLLLLILWCCTCSLTLWLFHQVRLPVVLLCCIFCCCAGLSMIDSVFCIHYLILRPFTFYLLWEAEIT